MPEKAVIGTGFDGLVGSRFVEMYQNDYKMTNLSLKTNVDITNEAIVMAAINGNPAPTIIHCAAFTDTNAAHQQDGDTSGACYRVNVLGTRAVAAAAAATGKYLIHISTDYVFDGRKDTQYTENDEPAPIDWYGKTKLMAEEEVMKSGANAAIVRIAFPYRAAFAAKADLLAKVVTGIKEKTLYPQFADTLITPTFVDDLAHVFNLMIDKKPTGVFHAVGSSSVSNYDFALNVAKTFKLDESAVQAGSLTEYLAAANRPYHRYLALSNQKLTSALEYHFATLDEGLAVVSVQKNNIK